MRTSSREFVDFSPWKRRCCHKNINLMLLLNFLINCKNAKILWTFLDRIVFYVVYIIFIVIIKQIGLIHQQFKITRVLIYTNNPSKEDFW